MSGQFRAKQAYTDSSQAVLRRQAAQVCETGDRLAQTGIRARLTQIVDSFAQTIRQISAGGQSGLREQADRFSADRQADFRRHAARQSFAAGSHISNILNIMPHEQRARLYHIANDYHAIFVQLSFVTLLLYKP
jgi:hypothetical protein